VTPVVTNVKAISTAFNDRLLIETSVYGVNVIDRLYTMNITFKYRVEPIRPAIDCLKRKLNVIVSAVSHFMNRLCCSVSL